MKITRLAAWRIDLPFRDGAYGSSGGSAEGFDSTVGGVTRARRLRDVAVELDVAVTVEDTGGSDIDTAAIAHLSLSTPEALRLHTVDLNNWVTLSNATGMPPCEDGRMAAPTGPGLGVEPRADVLGEPFHVSG